MFAQMSIHIDTDSTCRESCHGFLRSHGVLRIDREVALRKARIPRANGSIMTKFVSTSKEKSPEHDNEKKITIGMNVVHSDDISEIHCLSHTNMSLGSWSGGIMM